MKPNKDAKKTNIKITNFIEVRSMVSKSASMLSKFELFENQFLYNLHQHWTDMIRNLFRNTGRIRYRFIPSR